MMNRGSWATNRTEVIQSEGGVWTIGAILDALLHLLWWFVAFFGEDEEGEDKGETQAKSIEHLTNLGIASYNNHYNILFRFKETLWIFYRGGKIPFRRREPVCREGEAAWKCSCWLWSRPVLERHFRKYETIITCHGNRSSQGNETGGNIGKVGKDFEGEGGQDERQAPHQVMWWWQR